MAPMVAATAIDIICMICLIFGASMAVAAGAGIALFNETKISEKDRRIDGYVTGGLFTLVARFLEAWPTANSQLKAMFGGSVALCLVAVVVWIVMQALS